MNVNGSLRDFCPAGANYVGVDLEAGNGVDLVVDDPLKMPFDSESFDVILTSSCFEHDKLFWLTFLELGRLLRPGGLLYLSAPSNGEFHRYPMDCWRFYPDAGDALAQWAARNGLALQLVESFVCGREADIWNDCVMIFAKGPIACAGLHDGLPFPLWNLRRADRPGIQHPATPSEDMMVIHRLRKQLTTIRDQSRRLALAWPPTQCWVCGQADIPGRDCPRCAATPAAQAMARAVASFCCHLVPLQELVREAAPAFAIVDLGAPPSLASRLAGLPGYRAAADAAPAFAASSCDLLLSGGTADAAECLRLLKPGGALIAADGEGAPPSQRLTAAGFARVSADLWNGGPAFAVTGWKPTLDDLVKRQYPD